ncbi:MAG: DUF4136 domain-containing protein [Maribacter sp.]|nr:DUF4136 domain-containing protein [Maribacter sp.]
MSCHVVRVQTDYEKETDFTNYSTYNYFDDMQSGLSELDEKRLIKIFDLGMQNKGLLLSEEPDFLINIQSGIYQAPRSSTVGVGVGGTGRNVSGGVSMGIPIGQTNIQREVVFDFVDSQKDVLIWQAISKSHLNENNTPVEREKKLQAIVDKVLSRFPPKSRK